MDALNQIIVVEDDAQDYELITHALERAGCQFKARRVDSQEELEEELFRLAPDLVLCDHASARWNSFAILGQVRAFEPSMPFVVVSGGLDDMTTQELRQQGVDDCVHKDALADLAPTVRRVLRMHDEAKRQRVDQIRREVPLIPKRIRRYARAIRRKFLN